MRPDLCLEGDPLFPFKQASAFDRLQNILSTQTIHPSVMPWLPNNPKAVCFTECIWDALIRLSESYSSYGVVFSKKTIFDKGGGPVLYIRGDHLAALIENRTIPASLEPFIQPFDPTANIRTGVRIDFLHEREWRLPLALTFEYSDLQYVLVNSIDEATNIVHTIGSRNLPEEKVIPLSIYEEIRNAWGKE
jgi:hypothetical protein